MRWSLAEPLDRKARVNKRRGKIVVPLVQTAVAIVILMMQAGCMVARGTEGPIHTYRLSLEGVTWEPGAPRSEKEHPGILLVNVPQAEAGVDSRRMAYLLRPFEVSYYAANQWVDTPSRMLVPLLAQVFEKSGVWRAVIPMPSSVRGDYRLDSHSLALQQEFLQQPSRVRVTVRMQLLELREQRVIGARGFEIIENAPSEDAYGGVLAANQAVGQLLERVAAWVSACVQNNQACGR